MDSNKALATTHFGWISSQLKEKSERQKHFVESIAVGGEPFIRKLQTALGIKVSGKKKRQLASDEYHLRETFENYGDEDGNLKKTDELKISGGNTFPWIFQAWP